MSSLSFSSCSSSSSKSFTTRLIPRRMLEFECTINDLPALCAAYPANCHIMQTHDIQQCRKKVKRTFNRLREVLRKREEEMQQVLNEIENTLAAPPPSSSSLSSSSATEPALAIAKNMDAQNHHLFHHNYEKNKALINKQHENLQQMYQRWNDITSTTTTTTTSTNSFHFNFHITIFFNV